VINTIKGFARIPIPRILKIMDNPVIPLITVQTSLGGLTHKKAQVEKKRSGQEGMF